MWCVCVTNTRTCKCTFPSIYNYYWIQSAPYKFEIRVGAGGGGDSRGKF